MTIFTIPSLNKTICAFAITAITVFCLPAYAKGAESIKVWHLKQKHKIYGRKIDIYLNENRFKWTCKDSGITILMNSPDWQVNVYNMRTRNLFKCKAKDFKSPVSFTSKIFGGIDWSKLPIKKVGTITVSGVTLDRFRVGKTGKYLKGADYWASKSLPVNNDVTFLMSELYNAPIGGLPIKHLYQRPTAQTPTVGLQTMSLKQENMPVSTFAMPPKLNLVKSENEIFADRRHEKGLEWMIR